MSTPAEVLHPARTGGTEDRPVRWAEVAAWSGLPLRSDAQFHSVALPPTDPGNLHIDVTGHSGGFSSSGSTLGGGEEIVKSSVQPT